MTCARTPSGASRGSRPAFYVSLAVLAIAAPLLRPDLHPPFPPVDAGTVLSHVFFVHMEASVAYSAFVPGFGLNGPVWTLAIDMVFYALLPLVAGFWLRRPFLGFGIAAVLAAGWTLALDPGDQFFKHALDPSDRYLIWHQAPLFLADCAAGMTAAWCFVKLRARGTRVRPVVAVALASGALLVLLWYVAGASLTDSRNPLVVAGTRFTEDAWLRVLVPAVLGVFAVSVSLGPGWLRYPLANPLSRKLADISYSIYLYHVMVLHFCLFTLGFDREGTRADFLTLLAAALAITLVIAWVSYVLVERPGRRLGRRLARRYELPREAGAGRAPADRRGEIGADAPQAVSGRSGLQRGGGPAPSCTAACARRWPGSRTSSCTWTTARPTARSRSSRSGRAPRRA